LTVFSTLHAADLVLTMKRSLSKSSESNVVDEDEIISSTKLRKISVDEYGEEKSETKERKNYLEERRSLDKCVNKRESELIHDGETVTLERSTSDVDTTEEKIGGKPGNIDQNIPNEAISFAHEYEKKQEGKNVNGDMITLFVSPVKHGDTSVVSNSTYSKENANTPTEATFVGQDYNKTHMNRTLLQTISIPEKYHPEWASSSGLDYFVWECILVIVVLLLVGTVAFSLVFEHWSIEDSMYFTVVTLTTVGYGDMTPSTPCGRLFMSAFAIVGIAILAVAISVIGSRFVETQMLLIEDNKKNHDNIVSGKIEERTPNTNVDGSAMPLKQIWKYISLIVFLLGGAWFLFRGDDWTLIKLMYFIVATSTTIGYGDILPISNGQRLFGIVYILVSVSVMGEFLGCISGYVLEIRQNKFHKSMEKHKFNVSDIKLMDADRSGDVSELEYVLFMLKSMNKVDGDLLDALSSKFRELDVTGDGSLNIDDLKIIEREKIKRRKNEIH